MRLELKQWLKLKRKQWREQPEKRKQIEQEVQEIKDLINSTYLFSKYQEH